MEANIDPRGSGGCRSVNWEEESKYCKTFATIPQNVLSSMYPQEGKAKNGAIIDPCESERIEAVKFRKPLVPCSDRFSLYWNVPAR